MTRAAPAFDQLGIARTLATQVVGGILTPERAARLAAFADQHYWGRQVFELGLGSRPIARCALTAPKLTRAIRDVLSRPDIADRAREIKAGLDRTDGVSTLAQLLYEVAADTPAHRAA